MNQELTRVGFTGHQQDYDIGLTDMRGRVYDPLAARFTTPDPIMQAPLSTQGQNRYAYVFNDPINNVDPSGFVTTDGELGGGGGLSWLQVSGDAVATAGAVGAGLGIGYGLATEFGGSVAAGSGLGSALGGVVNIGLSLLSAPRAREAYTTHGRVPSSAPTSNSFKPNGSGALANNRGVAAAVQERAPLRMPDLPAPQGPDLRTADVGSCVFNPQACALALEQAVVRAAPWVLRLLPAVEGAGAAAVGSEAIVLLPLLIPGDSVVADTSIVRIDPTKPARDVLPGSLHREFPGQHLDKPLNQIKEALRGAKGKEADSLRKAKKLLEQAERLLGKSKG